MGKVKLVEVKSFAKSHVTGDEQSQNFNIDLINSRFSRKNVLEHSEKEAM